MKKKYIKPEAIVVMLQHRSQILTGSGEEITTLNSNTSLNLGGEGSDIPRVGEQSNIWDEEW